jgi:membrane protein implicated in regulation of membrane protease activity
MLEDKRLCPHCSRPLHSRPYLMAQRADTPLLPWPWALVLLSALVVLCLMIARAM